MASRPKNPQPRPAPRLYLVTPAVTDAAALAPRLAAALGAGDVAAVLLRLAEADERSQINCIKALVRPVQEAGAALVIEGHAQLVAKGGADGAHLADTAEFNAALPTLKPDRIAGCGGLDTRHDAMLAAEQDADYVMFGEPDHAERRAPFEMTLERVTWWAEVFEAPCVAYAVSLEEIAPLVAAGADFIALPDVLWQDAAGVSEAQRLMLAAMPESVS